MAGGYRVAVDGDFGQLVKIYREHDRRLRELERPTGSQTGTGGGGGGGESRVVRHEVAGGFSYLGSAPSGTGESSSGWTVTRIELDSPPVILTGSGSWTNRVSLTYS